VLGAIALVEGAIAERVLVALDGLELPEQNAFGEALAVERGQDVAALVRRAADAAAAGKRAAVVACAADLAAARGALAEVASRGMGLVVHAIAETGASAGPLAQSGVAPALALDDLPWGMLLAAGVADAVDLALVARRAAEDSGCPFFVVHERSHVHHVEPLSAPSRALCEALVGAASASAERAPRPSSAPPPARRAVDERALAERVPFALASAMRELGALTGRTHDVIERAGTDGQVALVGAGALGESLVADVGRVRSLGHDAAAVRVVAWRPFPGARLVKALGRAVAATVLERVDQPLAGNAPLAMQLKAAFADAMTWAPDFPGVGRIPRIVSGVLAPGREVDSTDLDAMIHNLLADERGKRAFVLGGDRADALDTPEVARTAPDEFTMRGIAARREVAAAAAEICSAVLASALGLRSRVAVRALAEDEGGGVAFDLVAARERPRGAHAPHSVRVIALDSAAPLDRGNPLARLAAGGLLALASAQRSADGLWSEVPPWVKALAFDRGARVVGWSPGASGRGEGGEGDESQATVVAAAFAGVALSVAGRDPRFVGEGERPLGPEAVAREVAGALASAFSAAGGLEPPPPLVERAAQAARAAFEGRVEVPAATVAREDDNVRLGRRDPRAGSAAR
jgi:pyruvate-ferredoxin/flavodoxin oxidoreductase